MQSEAFSPWRIAMIALIALPSSLVAQADPLPDAWFFKDRSPKLRSLEGEKAPALKIAEWRGDAVDLEDAIGKVVVVDFWATWCGPCMAAIPKNVALVNKHGDDVVFVGVHDSKGGWDKVDATIASKNINYPVGKDDGGTSTKAYNLGFWPTYVVIDKNGIVRGAGLVPDKVGAAVEKLLAESGPEPRAADAAAASSSFPDEWFLGGGKRAAGLRAAEGKKAPALAAQKWLPNTAVPIAALERNVIVYQFVHPQLAVTLDGLPPLAALEREYRAAGVRFVVVCDARGELGAMRSVLDKHEIALPVALDRPSPPPAEGEPKPGPGAFAEGFGVRFAPATVVVDRAGIVRAAGLDPKRLRTVVDALLAEPMPEAPTVDENQSRQGGER